MAFYLNLLHKVRRMRVFSKMHAKFEMSMVGESTCFLGHISNNAKVACFSINISMQKNMIKKFGLENAKHAKISMSIEKKLSKHYRDSVVDNNLLEKIITRRLLYFIASIAYIGYRVVVCAIFQANPRKTRMKSTELSATLELGIWSSQCLG